MSRAPLIGITLDSEEPGGYSKSPWYALRQNYAAAVAAAGGTPIMLPHEVEAAGRYLDLIDGLVVTGGAFDVDPAMFGATERHATVKLKTRRTQFEYAVTQGAIERDLPLLGICGGQQLMNVVLGGTLIQHIPDEVPNALAHEQKNPPSEPGHTVTFARGTRLAEIVGVAEMGVNTSHHQAAKAIGPNVVVNATAPDGVIEGIELQGRKFCIGVQWHPEYFVAEGDRRLLAAFIAASRR